MPRTQAKATQADIARAIKAVQRTGLIVSRVEVDGERIIVLTSDQTALEANKSLVQQWRERKNARETQEH
jgi:hypothetical protein